MSGSQGSGRPVSAHGDNEQPASQEGPIDSSDASNHSTVAPERDDAQPSKKEKNVETTRPKLGGSGGHMSRSEYYGKRRHQRGTVDDKWHVWHSEIRSTVIEALKKAVIAFGSITIWMWVCLPIFFGSTYTLESYFPNMTVHLINFDTTTGASSVLGPAMVDMANMQMTLPRSSTHLGWQLRPASQYPNGLDSVRQDILSQASWACVTVNANATSAYLTALENGDASYNPTGAISIWFQSARFYQITLLYIQPLLISNVESALTMARQQAYQAFITANANNATAIQLAAQVPQALGTTFSYNIQDLRSIPSNAWGAAAPMEAGLVFFVIFAFYICLYGGISRMKSGLQNRLTWRSMIGLRLGWPIFAYFWMSLWQTCVIRAFQVPLNTTIGRAGFFVLWMLNWFTIICAGLAMETVLAIVGIPFLPFFLIFWIVMNITSSFFPIELMPDFYHFFRWFPFVQNVQAYKIITFGTDLTHRLGLHFGVLFAIMAVEFVCFPLAITFERWKLDSGKLKEMREKEEKKE
ncbi:hypothetical protein P7C73_g850, partial [Tremellales sp. Uapishka_1]